MRVCFRLRVRPEMIPEYVARHAAVWPDMRQALREAGWRNYSLFLEDDGALTGYFECDDLEAAQLAMAATDVNPQWQREMAGFFAELGDELPDEGIKPIHEIFHLD
jgi:L-rhamnose mutarotase